MDMDVCTSWVFGKPETDVVKSAGNSRSYDSAFKKFFSRKRVLAAIILNIVPEFECMDVADVETYIESSEVCDDVAEVLSEEETTMGSKILFDVLVDCKLPAGNRTSVDVVIFDLEMQGSIICHIVFWIGQFTMRADCLHVSL